MFELETPYHAGTRPQARELVGSLVDDLAGQTVVIDCSHLLVATSSYLDEIVKQVLVERHADKLEVRGASEEARRYLERAGENRGVRNRLHVARHPREP